jgi:hypothetical protein
MLSRKCLCSSKNMVVFSKEMQQCSWGYGYILFKSVSYVLEDMVVFPKEMQPCFQRYGYVPLKSATMFLRTWLCSTRKNFIQSKCIKLSPKEILVFPNEHGFVLGENISWRKIIMFFDDHQYFFKNIVAFITGKNILLRHTTIFLK